MYSCHFTSLQAHHIVIYLVPYKDASGQLCRPVQGMGLLVQLRAISS